MAVDRRDIVCRNDNRIISSLTGGPDDETKVTAETADALVLAFGSPGDTEDVIAQVLADCLGKFAEWMKGDLGSPAIITA